MIANEEGGQYQSPLTSSDKRPNQCIDRQIPSFLSYIEGEEYHGTQAKSQLVRNSKNTVAYFRDYIGKEYGAIPVHHFRLSSQKLQLRVDRPYALPCLCSSSKTRLHCRFLNPRYHLRLPLYTLRLRDHYSSYPSSSIFSLRLPRKAGQCCRPHNTHQLLRRAKGCPKQISQGRGR